MPALSAVAVLPTTQALVTVPALPITPALATVPALKITPMLETVPALPITPVLLDVTRLPPASARWANGVADGDAPSSSGARGPTDVKRSRELTPGL